MLVLGRLELLLVVAFCGKEFQLFAFWILADKLEFDFFWTLVRFCGARTSCTTSCVCIIFASLQGFLFLTQQFCFGLIWLLSLPSRMSAMQIKILEAKWSDCAARKQQWVTLPSLTEYFTDLLMFHVHHCLICVIKPKLAEKGWSKM